MGSAFIVNHKVVQSSSSSTDIAQAFQMHTNWSPEDLPLGREQSKCHVNSDPQLAQEEVACSIGGNVFHCSTERNENFIGQCGRLLTHCLNSMHRLNALASFVLPGPMTPK